MRMSDAFRKGIDWVNALSPQVYILYGHTMCDLEMIRKYQPRCADLLTPMEQPGLYPLSSSKFYRLA
eukprot:3955894-Karenia_brevis.AAC.1